MEEEAKILIKTGRNCKIGNIKISGNGTIELGNNVEIHDGVEFNVDLSLKIGDNSIIGNNFIVEGHEIEIGKVFWSGDFCRIGGGSCHEYLSKLKVGDYCHFGNFVSVNTARAVIIGNEVGLGENTKIYTHGAYLSVLEGFPAEFGEVKIGDKVWIPQATILPNVKIGSNIVIAACSLVNKDIPDGCLAGGVPVRILKENCYPRKLDEKELEYHIGGIVNHFVVDIMGDFLDKRDNYVILDLPRKSVFVDRCMTLFNFAEMRIDGKATEITERFKNECRRYGIRFNYYVSDGMYKPC